MKKNYNNKMIKEYDNKLTHEELKEKALDTPEKIELYEKYRKESIELDKKNKDKQE